jgi:XapX domain-containing protein
MRIVVASIIAFAIGASSRLARIPSLATQTVVGSLLVVAMSVGYVVADRSLAASTLTVVCVSMKCAGHNQYGDRQEA